MTYDIPNIDYGELDFRIPTVLSSNSSYTSVLERSPEIIAFLEDAISLRKELVEQRRAIITMENKDAKQDEKKALFFQDEVAKKLRHDLTKAEVMLKLWEEARDSAKKFYNK